MDMLANQQPPLPTARASSASATATTSSSSSNNKNNHHQQQQQPYISDLSPIRPTARSPAPVTEEAGRLPSVAREWQTEHHHHPLPKGPQHPHRARTATFEGGDYSDSPSTSSPILPTHANAEEAEEVENGGWASPDEVLQLRAITHALIAKYQDEIAKLSSALQHTREERDQYLADIRATEELKTAYVDGKALAESSRKESRRTAEEQALLRLEVARLLTDNEKLKLALVKQKQRQDLIVAQRVSEAVVTSAAAHAKKGGRGGEEEERGGGRRADRRRRSRDALPSPSPTSSTTNINSTHGDGNSHGLDRQSTPSHSMPAVVDAYYHRLLEAIPSFTRGDERGRTEHGYGSSRGEEDGRQPRSTSTLATPSLYDEEEEDNEDADGKSDAPQESQQNMSEGGDPMNETQTPRASRKDTTTARGGGGGGGGAKHSNNGSSSIATPTSSGTSIGGRRDSDDHNGKKGRASSAAAKQDRDDDNDEGDRREGGASASTSPEYAHDASDATTSSTPLSTFQRRVNHSRGNNNTHEDTVPFPDVAIQQKRHEQQPTHPHGHRENHKQQQQQQADGASLFSAATASSPLPQPSLSSGGSAASSLPYLYQLPRTPAEALAAEAKLVASLALFKQENAALKNRLALVERLLSHLQHSAEKERLLQAHENEALKKRARTLADELDEMHGQCTLLQERLAASEEEKGRVEVALRAKEAAMARSTLLCDDQAGQRGKDGLTAEMEEKRAAEGERVRAEARAQLAAAQKETLAVMRAFESYKAQAEEEAKAVHRTAQEAEAALAEERRRTRALREEGHAGQQLAQSERLSLEHRCAALELSLATAREQVEQVSVERDSLQAQLASLVSERNIQADLVSTLNHQLADSCERLLSFEELKESFALLQLTAHADHEAKEALQEELHSQARVTQTALISLQEENDTARARLAAKLEKMSAKYSKLRIRFLALAKGNHDGVPRLGPVHALGKNTDRAATKHAKAGTGTGKEEEDEGGDSLVDARDILRASTAAAARLARSIHREETEN